MYIPKNKIITNLYTRGGEFEISFSGKEYIGPYHKLYTGEYFTGKNQNDGNVLELVPLVPDSLQEIPQGQSSTNVIALFLEDPDPEVDTRIWKQKDVVTYLQITGQSTKDDQPKSTPTQYYPTPTEDDYNLGVFTRYFCVKNNEDVYIELDKDSYDKLVGQNSSWLWELYSPFNILWTITGIENEVRETNKNMVLLQERRSKRNGLQAFLNQNYLKFYRPDLESQS